MLKRILCAMLASVMLVGALASCANTNPNPGTESSKPSQSGNVTESGSDAPALEVPDTKYNETITFLTRDESEWSTVEIFAEQITDKTDNISSAVYERNMLILEKYGITIAEMKVNTTEHGTKITSEIAGSNGDFQAIITNTSGSAGFATQGQIWNLHSDQVQYIDTSKPWWDTKMADSMTIHDRLYFATGDLLTADNDATFVLLFNKEIAADNQLPNLYNLVENKEWTMDAFYQYASTAAKEMNGNDTLEYDNDIAGFAYTGDAPYCFLFGGGVTVCTKDENDYPIYNLNVDRAQSISEMGAKLFDKKHAVDLNSFTVDGPTIMEVGKTNFGGGYSLFLGEVMQSVTRMRGFDVDFGILPFPMYDTAQKEYYSMMHATASMVSIPKTVVGDNLDMVSAVIEAMAYYSVDTLTHQYYEINLKTRDAKDVESGPMIDMILASRPCDLSYYFGWSGAFAGVAGTLLPDSGTNVASQDRKLSRNLGREIEKTVEAMDKNAEQDE